MIGEHGRQLNDGIVRRCCDKSEAVRVYVVQAGIRQSFKHNFECRQIGVDREARVLTETEVAELEKPSGDWAPLPESIAN